MVDDSSIQHRITALVDEEHRLRSALSAGCLTLDEERDRLRRLEVDLDECWDLLRQRRASVSAGWTPTRPRCDPSARSRDTSADTEGRVTSLVADAAPT